MCENVTLQDVPVKGRNCKEQDSQGCWMTYTMRQWDGRDTYDLYVEESLGEAGWCPGSGAGGLW
jgi:junctional adhesion protein 3